MVHHCAHPLVAPAADGIAGDVVEQQYNGDHAHNDNILVDDS